MNQFDTIKHLRFKSRLSSATLSLLKEHVYRILRDQEKDELFFKFDNWTPNNREIFLYTDYCSQGFQLPSTFNSIIQINKPEFITYANVAIPFAVLNGWAAINEIVKGHRHVCLLQFDEGVPQIIRNLPEVNDNARQDECDVIFFNH